MVNPNRFYTYAYLREDRTPYYIGKGKGSRIYRKTRRIKPPKDKSRIIFLKQNLTEEQAFKHEIIHFIDDKKNRKLNGKPDMSQKDWHNDSFEINAEFLSIMNEIRFQKDYVLPETFEDFLNSYKRFNVVTISQWENLTDKKKKSLVGRLYQYYTFLKDVFKKKKEKEANNI